jgi:ketosteroid isomerase-like protein
MEEAMSEADPLAVLDEFNRAWNEHDLRAALALVTDDCVFDNTTPAPDGERFVGKEAIRAAWKPVFDDPRSDFEVEEVFAAGDRVVQRWRYSWGSGHVRGVDLFRILDGRVAEKLSYVKG